MFYSIFFNYNTFSINTDDCLLMKSLVAGVSVQQPLAAQQCSGQHQAQPQAGVAQAGKAMARGTGMGQAAERAGAARRKRRDVRD